MARIAGLEVDELVIGAASGDRGLPLVLALHGRGGMPEPPFGSSIAPCRLLVPHGPVALGGGRAWSEHYAREGKHDALARDLVEVADRLSEILDATERAHGARGPAIVLGYSQGAMAALTLATRHADRIGDVIIGAAWVPTSLEPQRAGVRIRMAHGDADDVVPFRWGRELAGRLEARGLDVELRSFRGVGHDASSEMSALLTAWREAAIARASDLPEPPIPELGVRVRSRPSLWAKLRRLANACARSSGG